MVKQKKTAKPRGKKEKPDKMGMRKLLKKSKKPAIIISIAILLLASFAIYRVWLNIHFIITDDLALFLEPQDKSLSIHYNEKPDITFSADIKNSFFCSARCSYEFKDISAKASIDNGTFTSKGAGNKFKKTFQLSADRVGSGQKIYSFEVQCSNMRTWLCLTNGDKRKRSSFITLNYDISEYEKFLKENLKENITKLVSELQQIDIAMQELNNRFFELGFYINLNEIENDKEILNNAHDALVMEFKNLERVWSEQDYLLLSKLFNNSYDARILNISQIISDASSRISTTLEKHNSIVEGINKIDADLRAVNETILFLSKERSGIIGKHSGLLDRVREIKLQIGANAFSSYSFLENEIKSINESLTNFEKDAKRIFMSSYLSGSYNINLEKDILCSIKEVCLNKTDFSAAIADSLTIDDNKLASMCPHLYSINEIYEKENSKSGELIKNYDIGRIQGILDNAKSKKLGIARKNILNEIKNITAGDEADEPLNMLISISRTNISFSEEIGYGGFSENEILSLIQLNLSNGSQEFYKSYCKTNGKFNISGYYGNKTELGKVNEVKAGNFSSRIGIRLTENYPICCVLGVCRRCCAPEECRNDPSLYPVLFLHGHSLNKDNSPDFSLDAFNKIQARLQEDGYISAGTITPVSDYSEINQGEWGMSSKPVSVKGSYYLVSYYDLGGYSIDTQKSENIETYAIRLKELIDLLKFRTGRDKVIIIAHSMGSLVARSYMQIFGDSSVDKLIMLASPNNGITGHVSSYCPLLGEKKECNDMSANSIFIKKLNDPIKIPKKTKIYNIIGIGCKMGNETGDGIIAKKNAELDYAETFYINGTCSKLKPLHADMLDIDKYPEVYRTINLILKAQ